MKTKYLLMLLTVLLCMPVNAQKKNNKCTEEEFRAKKQAYMTEKAGLTEEEAENFFPLYFELQNKKKAANKEVWNGAKKGVKPETTDEEYEDIIDCFFISQHKLLDLEQEYIDKYRKVLSDKKIYRIYWAEIKFNRNMLKILQGVDKKDKKAKK